MKKATNFVIVDPSLRSSGVFIHNGINTSHYAIQTPKKVDRLEILGKYKKHFTELVESNNWDFLCVEDYSFGSHGNAVTTQAEVGGIIRGCFAAEGVPIIEMPIQTWKAVTGVRLKKGTKKDNKIYTETIIKSYGVNFDTTDECDAYLMYITLKTISSGMTDKGFEIRKQLQTIGIEI